MRKLFVLLMTSLFATITMVAQPTWSVGVTESNASILLIVPVTFDINGNDIAVGDYLGVFYESNSGVLECGGFAEWTGSNQNLIAYGADSGEDNGFATNEAYKWKYWDASENEYYDAEVTYFSGGPFVENYSADAFSRITSLTVKDGCTNINTFNYDADATNDDGSCVTKMYVSASTGNDANTGFSGSPKATLSAALDLSGTGRTVIVEDGSFTISTLTVDTDMNIEVEGESDITVTGNVVNNGTISLYETSVFLQGVSSSYSGAGTFLMLRQGESAEDFFNFWSSPVMNFEVQETFIGSNVSEYNTDTFWSFLAAGDEMEPARGYAINGGNTDVDGERTFTGTPYNGDIDITTGFVDATENWNLLGNPYPSAIDIDAFITANDAILQGSVYLWSQNTSSLSGQYAVWNAMGSVAGGDGIVPDGNVASCQGFFVRSDASGTVTFTNAIRTNNNDQFFKTASAENIKLKLQQNGTASKEILIGFRNDASDGFDSSYDAENLKGSGTDFYSLMGDDNYAIQGLAPFDGLKKISLGFELPEDGEATITMLTVPETYYAHLYDSFTDTFYDLTSSDYTFESSTGIIDNRFDLYISKASLNVDENSTDLSAYWQDDQIQLVLSERIEKIQLIGVNGQVLLESHQLDAGIHSLTPDFDLSNGVYFLKLYRQGNKVEVKGLSKVQ